MMIPIEINFYSYPNGVETQTWGRSIVDVVENNVNWGGALAAASELYGYDEDNVAAACIEAYDKTLVLLERAKQENRPPWFVLKETASHRIFEENHPVVGAARQYKFIGDINRGFNEWIKERWLRNIVDVEPDQFAEYAVAMAHKVVD